MKFSIFASKETTPRSHSRELKRFDTPDEDCADDLAAAYMAELLQQGYSITDVYQSDANGYPVSNKRSTKISNSHR